MSPSHSHKGGPGSRHLVSRRRVHISQSTMDCLKGEFEVEPGEGGSRCEYLKEKGIVTYLIVVPKQPLRNGINGVVSSGVGTGATTADILGTM